MNDSTKQIKDTEFSTLPQKFKNYLINWANCGYLNSEVSSDIESTLLESINKGEYPVGPTPLHPKRTVMPEEKELLVWIRANSWNQEAKYARHRRHSSFLYNDIVLVHYENIDHYELFWEYQFKEFTLSKNSKRFTKNYKEILNIISKTKNECQKKIGQLPYLGEKDSSGKLLLFNENIERPDYSVIKSYKYIELKDCISCLLGIADLGLIQGKEENLIEAGIYNTPILTSHNVEIAPYLFEDTSIAKTLKFKSGWIQIIAFVYEFLKHLAEEESFIKKRDIGRFLKIPQTHDEGAIKLSTVLANNYNFRFKTKDFIRWLNESIYHFPQELFEDTNEYDQPELSFEENLRKIFEVFLPEIDFLWDGMIKKCHTEYGTNLLNSKQRQRLECALIFFDCNRIKFLALRKTDINKPHIYERAERQRQVSFSKILEIVVTSRLKNSISKSGISVGKDFLFKEAKKFERMIANSH